MISEAQIKTLFNHRPLRVQRVFGRHHAQDLQVTNTGCLGGENKA